MLEIKVTVEARLQDRALILRSFRGDSKDQDVCRLLSPAHHLLVMIGSLKLVRRDIHAATANCP